MLRISRAIRQNYQTKLWSSGSWTQLQRMMFSDKDVPGPGANINNQRLPNWNLAEIHPSPTKYKKGQVKKWIKKKKQHGCLGLSLSPPKFFLASYKTRACRVYYSFLKVTDGRTLHTVRPPFFSVKCSFSTYWLQTKMMGKCTSVHVSRTVM